jgi:hypothetical protein
MWVLAGRTAQSRAGDVHSEPRPWHAPAFVRIVKCASSTLVESVSHESAAIASTRFKLA